MKPGMFRCRKGRIWSVPNVEELVEIDFDALAEKTNLQFNENVSLNIRYELAIYVSQVRVFESIPLSRVRDSRLKSVQKACAVLESFLELDEFVEEQEGVFDPILLYLWRTVVPKNKFEFDGKYVADYLAVCREKAKKEMEWRGRTGRPKNEALRSFLARLHNDYLYAGGKGRDCNRAADGTLGGSFLAFAKELLDLTAKITGVSYSEDALHDYVTKDLKL